MHYIQYVLWYGALIMYEYKARLIRVIDGDTLVLDLDLGFYTHSIQTCRLNGIDTPESRTRDLLEKKYGKIATNRVNEILHDNIDAITVKVLSMGKFGRPLIELYTNGASLNNRLIDERLAVRYYGQNKVDIESAHKSNYEYHENNDNNENNDYTDDDGYTDDDIISTETNIK